MKALNDLGLTNKGKPGIVITGGSSAYKDEELKKPALVENELEAHRNKWRNSNAAGGGESM